jgi:hypothetical protein
VGDYRLVFRALEDMGLLLLSDSELPSVAGLIAGEPVRGSWWSHPRAHEIFRVSEKLAGHADVTTAKLVANKVTFVHRKLWPALVAVGTSRERWQLEGLSRAGRSFLARIEREGELRTDQIKIAGGKRNVGDMTRELEKRLLAHANEVHTTSGRHAKVLESWERWAISAGVDVGRLTAKESQTRIEKAAERLAERSDTKPRLPWSAQKQSN